jgi:hypothetical protein
LLNYLAREITGWLHSPERAAQVAAARYLDGKHDILARERRVIGRGGQLEACRNLPNNRIVDNQYGKLVRQKVNYLVGNPFRLKKTPGPAGPPSFAEEGMEGFFNRRRRKVIRDVCEDAVGAGIGWVMPYFDAGGRLCLKRMPPYEVLPFWADSEHTALDCAVRVYERESCSIAPQGAEIHFPRLPAERIWSAAVVKHVEVYTPQGMARYTLEGGKLVPASAAGLTGWLTVNGRPWGWPRVPLVAFKAPGEQSLLGRVKSLQDSLNTLISDFQNSLQEDARNTILVLKNYDGADLAEFRHNLAAYGAVRVKTVDGSQGGVDTLRIHVDHQSCEVLAAMLKRAIIENGMGFDITDGTLRGTPNRMTLLAMYADIELDADGYEAEWKASFEELLPFIWSGAALPARLAGGGDKTNLPPCGAMERLEVVFDRYRLEDEAG